MCFLFNRWKNVIESYSTMTKLSLSIDSYFFKNYQDELKECQRKIYKMCIVNCIFRYPNIIPSILGNVSIHLQKLRMERVRLEGFDIISILQNCTKLKDVELVNVTTEKNFKNIYINREGESQNLIKRMMESLVIIFSNDSTYDVITNMNLKFHFEKISLEISSGNDIKVIANFLLNQENVKSLDLETFDHHQNEQLFCLLSSNGNLHMKHLSLTSICFTCHENQLTNNGKMFQEVENFLNTQKESLRTFEISHVYGIS